MLSESEESRMKKQYEVPKAEKLVFDYSESVVACYSPKHYCNQDQNNNVNPTNPPTEGSLKYNNDPNGQYFKCLATYYYNC